MHNTENKVDEQNDSKLVQMNAAAPAAQKPIINPEKLHYCTEPFYTLMQKLHEFNQTYGEEAAWGTLDVMEMATLTSRDYAEMDDLSRVNHYYELKKIIEVIKLIYPAQSDIALVAYDSNVIVEMD